MKIYKSFNDKLTKIEITSTISVWVSYETIVAFYDGDHLVVCDNVWGTTTGKHLNSIDGGRKINRLPYKEFNKKLNSLERTIELAINNTKGGLED